MPMRAMGLAPSAGPRTGTCGPGMADRSRLVTRARPRGGDAAVGSFLRLRFQIITNWNKF